MIPIRFHHGKNPFALFPYEIYDIILSGNVFLKGAPWKYSSESLISQNAPFTYKVVMGIVNDRYHSETD